MGSLPALGLLPFFDSRTVDPAWVAEFVRMAEAEGVESVWGVEHVVMAENYEPLYPYSPTGEAPTQPGTVMPDPLEWLSFAAALTSKLVLGTSVVVASQHSAAILAKRAATLDRLSGGRFVLGVGLGWQKEEYRACGVPYSDRGRRLDECIDAMRQLWQPGFQSFDGRYVSYERVECDTKPLRDAGVPIVIGGSSTAAARRAGERGDGWYPYVISPADYGLRAGELRAAALAAGRDPDAIELSVWPASYDFAKTFDVDFVRSYVDHGASRLVISANESGGAEIEDIRRMVGNYQERVLAKL